MAWHCYPLTFRLLGPVRVGHREVGNLQTTRHYVPGRVVWAALTARLTRNLVMNPREADYRTIGDLLHSSMRFSYLWPSLDGRTPFFPWEDPAGFAYNFLGSHVSTALDYSLQNAEAGSLHETEYIAPFTRQGTPVFLIGYLWVQPDLPPGGWQKALQLVMIGGERRYGWGRLKLETDWKILPDPPISDPDCFSWQGRIPAHLRCSAATVSVRGLVEPFIGWESRDHGMKRISPQITVFYDPGAQIPQDLLMKISPQDGIWEILA